MLLGVFTCILLLLTSCHHVSQTVQEKTPVNRQQITSPAPIDPLELSPGLNVYYLDRFYRSIDQMPTVSAVRLQGRKGKPLLLINHQFGKNEPVFDSGKVQGIGMVITGYIYLDQPGSYQFQAMANDGIEVNIAGRLVLSDPNVHGDRRSPIGRIDISATGWYPVTLRYFQRKGTATLKLYIQPPGEETFTIIPQERYAHTKDKGKH